MNADFPAARGRHFDLESQSGEPIRLAISGAAGRVNYSLVFRISAGGLFGPHQRIILRLLDVVERQQALDALRMELFECAFPLLIDVRQTADPDEAFQGADWIILLASQTGPTSRSDHAAAIESNGPIYRDHGRAINRSAPAASVLVVGTPSHTNCLIAMNNATNLTHQRWFALNRTYQIRATALIAEKLHVPASRLNRVNVWGNPGPHLYVDFHNSFVGDDPAWHRIQDPEWERHTLQQAVQSGVDEHFRLAGATPGASTAQAILETIRTLVAPTSFINRFGAGVRSDGSYGVPRDLVFGFPLETKDGRTWSIVENLYLDEFAQTCLKASILELEREAVLAGRFF